MHRPWGIVAVCLALATSACSESIPAPAPPSSTAPTSNPATPSSSPKPTFTPPVTRYLCVYEDIHRSADLAPRLAIFTFEPGGLAPDAVIAGLSGDCATPRVPLPGIGNGAALCDLSNDFVRIAVVKLSQGQTRLASFQMIKNRNDVYLELAKILADRL